MMAKLFQRNRKIIPAVFRRYPYANGRWNVGGRVTHSMIRMNA